MPLPILIRKARLTLLEFDLKHHYLFQVCSLGAILGVFSSLLLLFAYHKFDCMDGLQAYTYTRVSDGQKSTLYRSCK